MNLVNTVIFVVLLCASMTVGYIIGIYRGE